MSRSFHLLQPTPNWRSLFHDIWFTMRQPASHLTVMLSGRGYKLVRYANERQILFQFTWDLQ